MSSYRSSRHVCMYLIQSSTIINYRGLCCPPPPPPRKTHTISIRTTPSTQQRCFACVCRPQQHKPGTSGGKRGSKTCREAQFAAEKPYLRKFALLRRMKSQKSYLSIATGFALLDQMCGPYMSKSCTGVTCKQVK